METRIRELIGGHAILPVPVDRVRDDDDLFALGMTDFASIQLMLMLEETFDIEFPETMYGRGAFASISTIDRSVTGLIAGRA